MSYILFLLLLLLSFAVVIIFPSHFLVFGDNHGKFEGDNETSSSKSTMASKSEACAQYDKLREIVTVICDSTLSDVSSAIDDISILKKESPKGIWFLNSSLIISDGATLTISSNDVKWLKINSQRRSDGISGLPLEKDIDDDVSTPYRIQVFGRLELNGVKVTSWDPFSNNYTSQRPDGMIARPYITVEDGANPSRITNSEIAYLGYNDSHKQGLTFYGGDRSTLIGNRIHNLWFGLYTRNIGHMVIENNTVYNNLRYGIDPHHNSSDMAIKNNHIFNNRIGLICSVDCYNILFEGNQIHYNKEIGLMLSRNNVKSIARHNNISNSETGISVSESHNNQVYDNTISNSLDGIKVRAGSSGNLINNNTIMNTSECGIVVYLKAKNNTIADNFLLNYNASGICLKNGANENKFYSNSLEDTGKYGINVKDTNAVGNIFSNNVVNLATYAIRVYNNTDTIFIENNVTNTKGHQYIISRDSILNLDNTKFLGDRIRSRGSENYNLVKIYNSGTIEIITRKIESNVINTYTFNTDLQPYINKIAPNQTIEIYSNTLK
jgi:mannuronan 5-epimerase